MVWGVFNDGRIEFFCQAQNKVLKDLCRFGRLDVSLALRNFNLQLISKSTRWPLGLSLTIQVGGRMKKVAKVWDFSGFKLLTSGEGRFSGEVYGEALIFFFFFFKFSCHYCSFSSTQWTKLWKVLDNDTLEYYFSLWVGYRFLSRAVLRYFWKVSKLVCITLAA